MAKRLSRRTPRVSRVYYPNIARILSWAPATLSITHQRSANRAAEAGAGEYFRGAYVGLGRGHVHLRLHEKKKCARLVTVVFEKKEKLVCEDIAPKRYNYSVWLRGHWKS